MKLILVDAKKKKNGELKFFFWQKKMCTYIINYIWMKNRQKT